MKIVIATCIQVISLLAAPCQARFVVETVAGVPQRGGASDGPLAVAQFFVPTGLAVDPTSGSIYVADSNNHKVRVINCSTGTVTTFAGSQDFGFTDGPAQDARFQVGGCISRPLIGDTICV